MTTKQCYALAGELYGHLRESLGFGELVMFTNGDLLPPKAIEYRWTFKANGRIFRCNEPVLFSNLTHYVSIRAFANHLSDKWKNHHRRQTERSSA